MRGQYHGLAVDFADKKLKGGSLFVDFEFGLGKSRFPDAIFVDPRIREEGKKGELEETLLKEKIA